MFSFRQAARISWGEVMEQRTGFWDFLYHLTDWFMRFAVSNFYWFVLNIPFFFILLVIFWFQVPLGLLYYGIAFFLVVSLLTFPATSALFATIREWVLKREISSITKSYFCFFKENYKQSIRAGAIFTALWLIWSGDMYYARTVQNTAFFVSFLIMGFLLFVWTVNYFSFQANFRERLMNLLKNSFFFTLGKPLASLTIGFVGLSLFYVSFFRLIFLLPFFTFSLQAFVSYQIFHFVLLRVREKNR